MFAIFCENQKSILIILNVSNINPDDLDVISKDNLKKRYG